MRQFIPTLVVLAVGICAPVTGQELGRLAGHTDGVRSLSVSAGGQKLVSGSDDRTVRIWNTEARAQLRLLEGHWKAVTGVAFSPNGRLILSGSWDGTVRLWDAITGRELKQFKGPQDEVLSVAFSPDGRRVAAGSIVLHKSEASGRVAGAMFNVVFLWDVETGKEIGRFYGHADDIFALAFSPDGRRIVSGSDDGMSTTLMVWDIRTGERGRRIDVPEPGISSVAFSPDSRRIVSGNGRPVQKSFTRYSADGQPRDSVATVQDKVIRVWDVVTGRELRQLAGHDAGVHSVAFSPDGKHIVSGSRDKTIRLWDAESGRELRCFEGHTDQVFSVAFSAGGRRIVSASADNSIRIWDSSVESQ